MNTLHVDTPEVRRIAAAAFPEYCGRKFQVAPFSGSMRLDSYWDGGSRDYYALVNLITGKQHPIQENGTPFSNGGEILKISGLPPGIALVQHSIFLGKDAGITVYVHPDNMNRLALPAPMKLTLAEQTVLWYTASRKSSHNGRNRRDMAKDDSGLPWIEWETAKLALTRRGLLNKAGAITDAGRNAIGDTVGNPPQWPKDETKLAPRAALIRFARTTMRWARLWGKTRNPDFDGILKTRTGKLLTWSQKPELSGGNDALAGKCLAAIMAVWKA